MRNLFSWLHLSDIHTNHGSAEHHANQQKVLAALVRDLPFAVQQIGAPSPNAIFVTGDIGFSGDTCVRPGDSERTEYTRAKDWLLDVAGVLNLKQEAMFFVPGNHDVGRTDMKKGMAKMLLGSLRRGETELGEALSDIEQQPFLRARFAAYHKFCEEMNAACLSLSSWNQEIKTESGLHVRIVGLNTALLCNDDQDRGKLYLGEAQTQSLAKQRPHANAVVLALSHHPLEGGWLADEENAANWVRNHAHVHLSGHDHQGKSRDVRHGAGRRHVPIDAGAVHEDKRPRGEAYSHAYNIASIVCDEEGKLFVRVWPRRWFDNRAGFVVDSRGVDEPKHYAEHPLDVRIELASARPTIELQTATHTAIDPALATSEARFRQLVKQRYAKLTVLMPAAEPVELSLEQVYVDLKLIAKIPRAADTFSVDERRILAQLDGASSAARDDLERQFEALQFDRLRSFGRSSVPLGEPRSVIEFLAEPNRSVAVILGDPGSGKSTLLHLLAIRAAFTGRLHERHDGAEDTHCNLLPILVPLAAYDAHFEEHKASTNLRDFLPLYWSRQEQFPNAEQLFERALREGRALVLLDGLDEVMSPARRSYVVAQVDSLIRNAPLGNRFVLTSRYVGYRQAALSEEYDHLSVLDFGEREIEQFLQRFGDALESRISGGISEAARERLKVERAAVLAEIQSNPHLLVLAKNPLQLGMLALLRRRQGSLPGRRVELFKSFTDALLELRPDKRSPGVRKDAVLRRRPAELRRYLRELALWMHQERPSRTAKKREVLSVLEKSWLEANANDPTAPTSREGLSAAREAEEVLVDLQHVTGIIIERGHDAFGFSHLTYQEFYVAEALASLPAEKRWEILQPVLHQARWREPILLCAGHLGVLLARPMEVDKLVRQILRAESEFENRLRRDVFLAAEMAAEDVGISGRVLNEVAAALEVPVEANLSSIRRRGLRSIAQLARIGHTASVERLLALMKEEASGNTRGHTYVALSAVDSLLGEERCRPILDWVKDKVDALLKDDLPTDLELSAARALLNLSLSYFIQNDRTMLQRVLLKFEQGWDDWFLAFHELESRIHDDPEVRASFLKHVTHGPVQQPALLALAKSIPEDPDVLRLLDDAWTRQDGHLRSAVVAGAMKLAPNDQTWKARIIECLEDCENPINANTIRPIGRLVMSDVGIRERYVQFLQHPNPSIVSSAVGAVGPLLKTDTRLHALLRSLLGRSERKLRQIAVQQLSTLAPTHPEIAEALRACLDDYAPEVRQAALQALAKPALTEPSLRDEYLRRLDNDKTGGAACRIGSVAPLALVDDATRLRIEPFLRADDPEARIAAIQALAPLARKDEALRKKIVEGLDDSDTNVQKCTVDALRRVVAMDEDLLTRFLVKANWSTPAIRQRIVETIAPLSAHLGVRSLLLTSLDKCRDIGSRAAKAIANLAKEDSTIREKIHTLVLNVGSLDRSQRDSAFAVFDAIIEQDCFVFDELCKYTRDPLLGARSVNLLCGHPGWPGIKHHLIEGSRAVGSYERLAPLRGLVKIALEDEDARQRILEALSELDTESDLALLLPRLEPLLSDTQIRQRILEYASDVRFRNSRNRNAALKCLANSVARDPDVEALFREVFTERRADEQGFVVASIGQAAVGLAPIAQRDPALRQSLLPWLGARLPAGELLGRTLRRALADSFAPIIREDETFRNQIINMLDSNAWQDRQGAAWTLIAEGGDILHSHLDRLRALLDDDRAEESWTERLHAASALINHPDPELCRKAIAVAGEALRYGCEPWYWGLGATVRQQAARVLAQIQPMYRNKELTELVVKAFDGEQREIVRESLYQTLLQLCSAPEPLPL